MLEQLTALDVRLFYLINHFYHSALTDSFAMFVDLIVAYGIIFVVMALAVYVTNKSKFFEFVAFGGLALASAFALSSLFLKNLIQRARPHDVLADVILVGKSLGEYSYPSSHTAVIFAVFVISLFVLGPKDKFVVPILGVLAILTAFGRVYVGHHYPFDVMAGAIIGTLVAIGLYYLILLMMKGVYDDEHEKSY